MIFLTSDFWSSLNFDQVTDRKRCKNIKKEGRARPRAPVLLLVWQRLRTLGTFSHHHFKIPCIIILKFLALCCLVDKRPLLIHRVTHNLMQIHISHILIHHKPTGISCYRCCIDTALPSSVRASQNSHFFTYQAPVLPICTPG